MLLREEVEEYSKLTGKDGWKTPVGVIGTYLDGYYKGLEVLDKVKEEVEHVPDWYFTRLYVLDIINRYKVESEIEE